MSVKDVAILSIVAGIFQLSCLANEQIVKETAIPSVHVR